MRTRPWRRCQSRRTSRASNTATTRPPNDQLRICAIWSSVCCAAGDGSRIWAKAACAQAGSAASAATCRPASITPSSDSTGTSTAATSATDCTRAYHGRTLSQKCRPSIACDQAIDQGRHLLHAGPRRMDKIDPEKIEVIKVVGSEEVVGDAGAGDVMGEQYRDRETEHDLGQLAGAQAQGAPLPQRPQRQRVMNQKAAVEQRLRRRVRPEPEDPGEHPVHGAERDQADGMVREMHRHIGEHHQTRTKPQSPDHRPRQGEGARPLASSPRRPAARCASRRCAHAPQCANAPKSGTKKPPC